VKTLQTEIWKTYLFFWCRSSHNVSCNQLFFWRNGLKS